MSYYNQCRRYAQVRTGLRSWTACRHGNQNCPPIGLRWTCGAAARPRNGRQASDYQAVADLGQHYGVARNTVMKALRRLTNDGLIEIVPNWGTFRART